MVRVLEEKSILDVHPDARGKPFSKLSILFERRHPLLLLEVLRNREEVSVVGSEVVGVCHADRLTMLDDFVEVGHAVLVVVVRTGVESSKGLFEVFVGLRLVAVLGKRSPQVCGEVLKISDGPLLLFGVVYDSTTLE